MNGALRIRYPGVALVVLPVLVACSALLKADDSTIAAGPDAAHPATSTDSGGAANVDVGTPLIVGPPLHNAGTGFGNPVVLYGNMAAAAASLEDAETDSGLVHRAGATYLFDLNDQLSARRIVVPHPSEDEGILPSSVVPEGISDLGGGLPATRLALNDDVLVIGVPTEDSGSMDPADHSAPQAGAVYVYPVSLDAAPQYIKAPSPHGGDLFGESVALSGSWLAIGAPGDASGVPVSGADATAPKSGAVYVYRRNPNNGQFEGPQYVKAPVIGAQDWFGHAVAIDGELMAIGAPAEDGGGSGVGGDPHDDSQHNSGAVYAYRRVNDTWSFEKYVKPKQNTAVVAGDGGFGWSVAVSGTRIATGSNYGSGCSERVLGRERGVVHIVDTTSWTEDCVEPPSGAAPVLFGWSVALFGGGLLIGAVFDSSRLADDPRDTSQPGAGAAYLFAHRSGGWTQRSYIKSPSPRALGFGLSTWIGPDRFAIGSDDPRDWSPLNVAPFDPSVAGAGAFYVYPLEL